MNDVRQREPSIVIKKLRELANGKPCMMRVPDVCNGNWETTVLAHSNRLAHGKGVNKKSDDVFTSFACMACHDFYDDRTHNGIPREEKQRLFNIGRDETWKYIARNGHLKIIL